MADRDIGKTIQKTLVSGLAVSVTLVLAGLLAHLVPATQSWGAPLVTAGLFALILTPVARVAMLCYAFKREGLNRYAFAAGAVLLIMLAGFFASRR